MDIIDEISNKIIKASTTLSSDKENALKLAIKKEDNENAQWALKQIYENYKIANVNKFPLCDDTGIVHVIIEVGDERHVSANLITQIHEGISSGLNNLPARPMAVRGNDIERIEQNKGLYDSPGYLKPSPILIDTVDDDSTYRRNVSPDTLNVHFLLQGGGPEIRSKTYRVFHKRSLKQVLNTIISWLYDSLKLLGCTPSIPAVGIGRTHFEAASLMLKSMAYGNLNNQNEIERYINLKLNESGIGPLGFGGKTTVLGSYVNVGSQRASGVRIVSVRPSCFVEPRVSTLKL